MPHIGSSDATQLLGQVNLNHLLYFGAVGRAGSVTRAAERLGVSQPSVSEQVRTLETRLGTRLLDRGRRGVRLTPAGARAMRYAEEVVGVCSDLIRSLPLDAPSESRPLSIGAADAVPKIVVRSIVAPLLSSVPASRVICREWRVEHLLSELSLHRLDMAITDSPLDTGAVGSMRSYPAAVSSVDLYTAKSQASRMRRLAKADIARLPMLLPAEGSSLRASIDRWYALRRVKPNIAAEADDRSLLHHFAEAGYGVVPVASITARDVARQFGLVKIAQLDAVQEQYFMHVMTRENDHPGVSRIKAELTKATPRRR